MRNVYYLETQYNYHGWDDVFLSLVNHLKEDGVNVVHQKGGRLFIEKYNYHLPDCELVIEDTDKDQLWVISYSETKSPLFDLLVKRNNPNDLILITQLYNWFPKSFDTTAFNFQIKPTVFYGFTPTTNLDHFYNLRTFRGYDHLIDKMFSLFSTHRGDPMELRKLGLCSESPGSIHIDQYLYMAIEYKVGLSIASVAEIAYREIEYMGIGLPNLRMEYMTQLDPPLIPDFHYISVKRDGFNWDANSDRNGSDKHVEAYKKRFLEVKDDIEFLTFITKNAREYYVNYCSNQNKLSHILKLLNL